LSSLPRCRILDARPGSLHLRVTGQRGADAQRFTSDLKEALDEFDVVGLSTARVSANDLRITFDAVSIGAVYARNLAAAASSVVKASWGFPAQRSYGLPVIFGGAEGPDFEMACILADTSRKGLIRRLTTTPHVVRAFTVPAASPLMGRVSWRWQPFRESVRACRTLQPGALFLSADGIGISTGAHHRSDLVIGVVADGVPVSDLNFRIGDVVRLVPGRGSRRRWPSSPHGSGH
jgi:allophanate hydrolase subunit 1